MILMKNIIKLKINIVLKIYVVLTKNFMNNKDKKIKIKMKILVKVFKI